MCFAKQLIDQKNYYFQISILVGIFFMPNSVILIASARFNFSTALSTFEFFYYTQVDSCSGFYCVSCRFFKNFFNYFYVCNSLFHKKNSYYLVQFDGVLECFFFYNLKRYCGGRLDLIEKGDGVGS